MKKKIFITLLLLLLAATTWATPPGGLEGKIRTLELPAAINAQDMTLEEFTVLLSARSGINITAVPEVADIKVNLQLPAGQRLEEVLQLLCRQYALEYNLHAGKNAVIFMAAQHSYMRTGALPPGYALAVPQAESMKTALTASGPLPPAVRWTGDFNTEEYGHKYDNTYQEAAKIPLSTFSLDVDTAAYSNVRRFLNTGKLPPADAVRTEEMINYFTYDYPQPEGEHPFSLTTEVQTCPWAPQHKLVMIGLQGKNIPREAMPPGNLVFLIDVSGSMADANKLPLLKTAFKMLVKQLRPEDTVTMVVYAGAAGVALEPTPGNEKQKILAAIDSLEAGGSTAGGEGLKLAYKLAGEQFKPGGNNRVILATDGDFNVGITSEGELTRLIEERRNEGIFLSVLGFGMGNIKDNKMELLADKGNGNYAYIDNALEAKKVMIEQMAGTLYTIAKDVKLQVEFNPAQVKYYRLIGYENRVLENRDFNDDKKDAGEMGAGHAVTAFYEIIPAGSAETAGATDPLRYQQSVVIPSDDLLQVKIRYKKPGEENSRLFSQRLNSKEAAGAPSENFRFAASVAEYALLLRDSEFKGQASYRHVLEAARSVQGPDAEGYRAEFIRLVEISRLLDDRYE
ncbi:MAG: VWA domain-containing protein [Bacillota bacterium]